MRETPSALSAPSKDGSCIACGYVNGAGKEICDVCGSSLNLKLCSACKAINAAQAENCHACHEILVPSGQDSATEGIAEPSASSMSQLRRQRRLFLALPLAATLLLVFLVYDERVSPWRESLLAPLISVMRESLGLKAAPPRPHVDGKADAGAAAGSFPSLTRTASS